MSDYILKFTKTLTIENNIQYIFTIEKLQFYWFEKLLPMMLKDL